MLVADAAQRQRLLAAAEHAGFAAGIGVAVGGDARRALHRCLSHRSRPPQQRAQPRLARAVRQVRLGLESLPALLRGHASRRQRRGGGQPGGDRASRASQSVAVILGGSGARSRTRGAARRADGRAAIAALLDADLSDQRRGAARQHAEEALAAQPAEAGCVSRHSCEALVEEAIESAASIWTSRRRPTSRPCAAGAGRGGHRQDRRPRLRHCRRRRRRDQHVSVREVRPPARQRHHRRGPPPLDFSARRQLAHLLIDAVLPGAAACCGFGERDASAPPVARYEEELT